MCCASMEVGQMLFNDLREFINAVDRMGELKRVEGAHWDLEIGAITELVAERKGPALLFDKIVDYPGGYRILTNAFGSLKRTALVLGLPLDLDALAMLKAWREKTKQYKPVPPVEVSDAPVSQNILAGTEIDLYKFPAAKWHEADGGRYLGTGCAVIVKDPEEDWVNVGTYRCMLYNRDKIFVNMAAGKHGRLIMDKYHARGKSCPVVISLAQDPALWMAATYNGVPWGMSEFDFAGWLRGKPIEVIRGEVTGLPIPARAEVVLEGEIPPLGEIEPKLEGPFGEWLGYVSESRTMTPIMRVKAILHRDDPTILGAPPLKPPRPYAFSLPLAAISVWDQLEGAGVVGVKGVWIPCFDYARAIVVAIKQMFPGHSKQAALAAASCRAANSGGRIIIVVDDDVDITNLEEVFWAVATRADADNIEIVKGMTVTGSDPLLTKEYKEKWGLVKSRLVIDACRPYMRLKDFPPVNVFSPEYRQKITSKWHDLLTT